MQDLNQIINQFTDAKARLIEPFGSGHINDTYRVFLDGENTPSYVLQRINTSIFKDVDALCTNIRKVTGHIEQNLNGDKTYKLMKPVASKFGNDWFTSADGQTWRVFNYIQDSTSIDLVCFPNQAKEAGKAYGWFLGKLNDFPHHELVPIIPDFHNMNFRLSQLKHEINFNPANRLKDCSADVDFYLTRSQELLEFYGKIGSNEIPVRVTHNDTKVNNVLFSPEWKAISVIDLDTVMPGVVHFDFGDSIRTIAATATEDELDLSKVGVNLELFKSFSEGFLSQMSPFLTPEEKNTLYLAPKLMTYIMGIRFLADYLRGDTYYKVKHPLHNIQRARNQMALIVDLERKTDKIKQILDKL